MVDSLGIFYVDNNGCESRQVYFFLSYLWAFYRTNGSSKVLTRSSEKGLVNDMYL